MYVFFYYSEAQKTYMHDVDVEIRHSDEKKACFDLLQQSNNANVSNYDMDATL